MDKFGPKATETTVVPEDAGACRIAYVVTVLLYFWSHGQVLLFVVLAWLN